MNDLEALTTAILEAIDEDVSASEVRPMANDVRSLVRAGFRITQ